MNSNRRGALVFLALALITAVASTPALFGSWVYDDRLIVAHPMLDGLEDIVPAFARSSDDYQEQGGSGPRISAGTTYRPLPMISFVLVNGTIGAHPLAHHLVSFALHLIAVAFLCHLASGAWAALAGVAVFSLHPAMGEAYLWINGRADVMAGALLAGTLGMLGARPGRFHSALLYLLFVAGALSKETFLIPAATAVIAGPRGSRRIAFDAGIFLLAFVSAFLLRVGAGHAAASTLPTLSLSSVARTAPHLFALAIETVVAPLPRPMRFMGWELLQSRHIVLLLGATVLLLSVVLLVLHRHGRAIVLALGVLGTLLPSALVADSLWLGFDRYLYVPAILLLSAALPWLRQRRWDRRCLFPFLLLAMPLFGTACFYRSHQVFAQALLEARPEDPSGYVFSALDSLDRGDRGRAVELLLQLPKPTQIPSVAHQVARVYLAIGDQAAAAAVIERAAAEHPDSANLRFDLFALRGPQGRWADAAALARELSVDPARRRAVRETIDAWDAAGLLTPEVRDALKRASSRD